MLESRPFGPQKGERQNFVEFLKTLRSSTSRGFGGDKLHPSDQLLKVVGGLGGDLKNGHFFSFLRGRGLDFPRSLGKIFVGAKTTTGGGFGPKLTLKGQFWPRGIKSFLQKLLIPLG